ncbi:hypothetical protein D3C74_49650 [compost metagenome]
MDNMTKHLWEVKHPYYCNLSNYRTPADEGGHKYASLQEFLEEWDDADLDYCLLFRWDWVITEQGEDELQTFWIMQRVGDYQYCTTKVNKGDEDKVKAFLQTRWEYMKELWGPFI